jgi:hypothetical protein
MLLEICPFTKISDYKISCENVHPPKKNDTFSGVDNINVINKACMVLYF